MNSILCSKHEKNFLRRVHSVKKLIILTFTVVKIIFINGIFLFILFY